MNMAVSSVMGRMLVRIEVHMDTLCPWCYVQKKCLDVVLERFQERHPEVEFEVLWRPFYLYPLLQGGTFNYSTRSCCTAVWHWS